MQNCQWIYLKMSYNLQQKNAKQQFGAFRDVRNVALPFCLLHSPSCLVTISFLLLATFTILPCHHFFSDIIILKKIRVSNFVMHFYLKRWLTRIQPIKHLAGLLSPNAEKLVFFVSTRRTRNMRRRSKEQELKISFLSNSCFFFSFKDDNTIYRLLMTLEITHIGISHTMTLKLPHNDSW